MRVVARGKWRYIDGKLVEWDAKKVDPNAPNIIQDSMEPVVSHATAEGLVFDSKSAIRRHYKELGFEDTGGSHLTGKAVSDYKYQADEEALRHEILEAKRRLQWGMEPMTEKEKQQWVEEERAYKAYKKRQR